MGEDRWRARALLADGGRRARLRVNDEGAVFCLSGSDGTELWNFRGNAERASILSNASPAVDGDVVVVPFPSGDIVALRVSTTVRPCGRIRWRARAPPHR